MAAGGGVPADARRTPRGQGTSLESRAPRALDGCRSDHLSLVNEVVQCGLLRRTHGLSQPGRSAQQVGPHDSSSTVGRRGQPESWEAGRPVPWGGRPQPGVGHTAWGPLACRPQWQDLAVLAAAGRPSPQTCRAEMRGSVLSGVKAAHGIRLP